MSQCRSCEAEVIWATHHRTGNLAPYDAEPTPEGTWHITDQLNFMGDNERIATHGVPGGRTSHFATCPNAATHRKQLEGA